MKCNFSFDHYLEVLDSLKSKNIGSIGDFPKLKNKKNFVMLRHDVDFSLDYALEMAKKEASEGLRSSYFILLHSFFYNPLEKNNLSTIRKIIKLGHEVGLHYDTSFFPKSPKKEMDFLIKEVKFLEDITRKKVVSVAQHIPSETRKFFANLKKARLIGAQSPEVLKSAYYISDSGHYWREGCMCQHINKHDRLQVLTHPIWWVNGHHARKVLLKKFESDEKIKLSSQIDSYKKIVQDLMVNLGAPANQFD